MRTDRQLRAIVATLILGGAPLTGAHAADDRQSLEELRNTVINLLQALVDQGVITREKAQQMVKAAQDKAAADAAALAKSDEGAVRVPYVPQIVKEEIKKQIEEEMKPAVVADVVQEAKDEKWGIPGALPDWLGRTRVYGSVMIREEGLMYSGTNQQNYYLNFNAVNSAGGITKAGLNAWIDVDQNRYRFRGAARLGVESSLTDWLKAGIRISTGNTSDLVSPSQTLDGTAPYSFGVDNLYLRIDEKKGQFPWLTVTGGRFTTPWFTPTDLVFHKQLNFNGLAATGRLGFGDGSADQSHVFLTMGALPIQEIALSSHDKWLYGAQLGLKLRVGGEVMQTLQIAGAYFDYRNVEGVRNSLNSNLLDYTAPQFFRTGNTVFDIRNDNDPTTNLFALAAKFHLANVNATYELFTGPYSLRVTADGVKNVGFNQEDVFLRTGVAVPPRVKGYQGEVSFGTPAVLTAGAWRALVGYRYLQRDAVIDAYTDSDFHFGGTDAKGYYLTGELGLANRVWMTVRYMSASQIDGPTYIIDTAQIDLSTRF